MLTEGQSKKVWKRSSGVVHQMELAGAEEEEDLGRRPTVNLGELAGDEEERDGGHESEDQTRCTRERTKRDSVR